MKKLLALLIITISITGCGQIKTDPLPFLCCDGTQEVVATAQYLSPEQAKRFIGTDLRAAKAKAIHITLKNRSNKHFHVSRRDISLPEVSSEWIFKEEKQSTVARSIGGWFVGGLVGVTAQLLFTGEVHPTLGDKIVGATCFGVSSHNHNHDLERKVNTSAAIDGILREGKTANFVIFVPETTWERSLEILLYEQPSGAQERIVVEIERSV